MGVQPGSLAQFVQPILDLLPYYAVAQQTIITTTAITGAGASVTPILGNGTAFSVPDAEFWIVKSAIVAASVPAGLDATVQAGLGRVSGGIGYPLTGTTTFNMPNVAGGQGRLIDVMAGREMFLMPPGGTFYGLITGYSGAGNVSFSCTADVVRLSA
jgi:hypothetical protein